MAGLEERLQQSSHDNDNDDDDKTTSGLLYGLEERPPWWLLGLLSFQDFLLSVTNFIPNPLVLAVPLCMADDVTGLGEFIATTFFVGGLCSLLQTSLGVRLPIVQGPSSSFIAPIVILFETKAQKCPVFHGQVSDNSTAVQFAVGSYEHRSLWKENLLELQGSLMLASLLEVAMGFTGLVGAMSRYIGPLTTSTVIFLIGISLVPHATEKGATHWWICFMTIALIILFSQYLRNVTVAFFGTEVKVFMLFSVLLAMVISWLTCLTLTLTGVLPDKKGEWGYEARTDIKAEALSNAQWFRFPYPGQWGVPSFSTGAFIAMLTSVLVVTFESVGDYHMCARLCGVSTPPPSAINRGQWGVPSFSTGAFIAMLTSVLVVTFESVGDYHMCARLCGVSTPPPSAINRGLGMNGICCLLAGAWGTGGGMTSFSQNIAAIGLTKVGSRVVVQVSAVLLMVAGCVGKVGALFTIVPDPVVGAMIFCMFGMVVAVGVSNLQMADLGSTRNLFVFGFSIFFATSVPQWVEKHPVSIGDESTNQVLTIFCSTSMLVGGFLAFFLDNTIPGTLEERGIAVGGDDQTPPPDDSPYDIPGIRCLIDKVKCCRYVPFCPGFLKDEHDYDKTNAKRVSKSESYGSIYNCD